MKKPYSREVRTKLERLPLDRTVIKLEQMKERNDVETN